jgi:hypothetical protein
VGLDILSANESEQGGDDVEIHIQTLKIDGEGHLLTANLPPPASHTSNEPDAANSVGWGWYWTPCLCEIVAEGEWDTINNIFCTQKHRLQNEYSHLIPQNAVAASPIYSKAGPSGTKAGHWAKALNGAEAAQKSWFRAGVGICLRRSKPWWREMIGGHPSMARWCVCASRPLACFLPPWFRKKRLTFFRLGASFLSEFEFFIQKLKMFELFVFC